MSNRGSVDIFVRALGLGCAFMVGACVAGPEVDPRVFVVVDAPSSSSGGSSGGDSTGVDTTTGVSSDTSTGTCTGDELTDVVIGEAEYPPADGCGGGDLGGDVGGDVGGDAGASTGGSTGGSTSTSTSGGGSSGGDESGGDTGIQCADDPPPFDLGKRDTDPKSGIFINNGTNAAVAVTVTLSHPCVVGKTISLLEVPKGKTVHITVANDLDAEGWTVTITKGGKELKPDEGKKKVKWKVGDTVKEGEIKAKTVTFE